MIPGIVTDDALENPAMTRLQRCMESLTVCHLQDESHWPAARMVARQDIDSYLRDAGPQYASRRQAIDELSKEFELKFPDESDPVLIRSYMRQIDRDLRREAERTERGMKAPQVDSSADRASAPSERKEEMAAEAQVAMTEQQRQDIARLCHEANIPDRSDERHTAESAQHLIKELREKAAERVRD